ncbi:MAG: ATP synthase F0 subunit B [Deltaproteobacteria bacterium]|jgi:F-type H+-transporting ATPase subunit b|nr:ATP synthase F0 subunit B [Deltaproteobacteria bacterium]
MVTLTLNWTLATQLLVFLVLMWVLNKILYKPILEILRKREDVFEDLKEKARSAKKAMEEGESESEEKRTEVLRLGVKSYNTLKEEGHSMEKDILGKAQKEAAKNLEDAVAKLKGEVDAAGDELRSEAEKLGREMASALLGREIKAV